MEQEIVNEGFRVNSTSLIDRDKARYDVVICINKQVKRKLKIKSNALVRRSFGDDKDRQYVFNTVCKVVVSNDLANNVVRLDQMARHALGIPFGYTKPHYENKSSSYVVSIYPMHYDIHERIRNWIVDRIGVRRLYYRVYKAFIMHMENRLIAMNKGAIEALATHENERIVIENPILINKVGYIRKIRRTVLEIGEDKVLDRMKHAKEKDNLSNPHYQSSFSWIKDENDIEPIFIDGADREDLGLLVVDKKKDAHVLHPVMVRRSIKSLIKSEFINYGFVLLLSTATIMPIMKDIYTKFTDMYTTNIETNVQQCANMIMQQVVNNYVNMDWNWLCPTMYWAIGIAIMLALPILFIVIKISTRSE